MPDESVWSLASAAGQTVRIDELHLGAMFMNRFGGEFRYCGTDKDGCCLARAADGLMETHARSTEVLPIL